MRAAVLAFALIGLSGCVTDQQREIALSAKDDTDCRAYGAKPGSQAYYSCRMAKDQDRQTRRTQLQAAILARPDPAPSPPVVIAPAYPAPYGAPTQYLNTQSGLQSGFDSLGRSIELNAARNAQ